MSPTVIGSELEPHNSITDPQIRLNWWWKPQKKIYIWWLNIQTVKINLKLGKLKSVSF
jgi:hypothetical protein